jgi:mannan endo-1,4-beta-mannosidase
MHKIRLTTLFLLCINFLQAQTLIHTQEAENCTLAGGLQIQTARAGYTGSGYVGNMKNAGDNMSYAVNITTSGNYSMTIRYNGANGPKKQDIYINNVLYSNMDFPGTSTGWYDLASFTIFLNQGSNTISIRSSWGWNEFDKFSIYSVPKKDFTTTSTTLIDAQANQTTKDLYNYLRCNYGKVILSGHTSDYYNSVSPDVNKKPVVRAYDFQHYTVGYSYLWDNTINGHKFGWEDDGSTQNAINWYNSTGKKGIVSFQWHWHSPSGGNVSTNTFYTNQTTFDASKAVQTGTAENTAILRDIDSIATQLKRLQTAGVPVLFRPLHEAGGAWFWWGAKGSTVCKQLWDIVYNRINSYHNIHNLIWVWSTPESDWYPGNSKVDIIGYDSYPGAYQYTAQSGIFSQLYTIVNGQKIIAMTENGPIPTIDDCFTQDAPWAYFLTWSDLYSTQNSTQQLTNTFSHNKVITIDETMPLSVVATASNNSTLCPFTTKTLSTPVVAGYTYQWYKNNAVINSATNATYVVSTSGNYFVKVANATSCGINSTTIAVNYYNSIKPIITVLGNTTACLSDNMSLSSSAGVSYNWLKNGITTGITTQTFSPTTLGANAYSVVVKNGNGCYDTSLVTNIIIQQCTTTSTTNAMEQKALSVAPNPFDNFTVITNHLDIKEIWVYNSKGELVENTKIGESFALGQQLDSGLYVIRYELDNIWYQVKIIKK